MVLEEVLGVDDRKEVKTGVHRNWGLLPGLVGFSSFGDSQLLKKEEKSFLCKHFIFIIIYFLVDN